MPISKKMAALASSPESGGWAKGSISAALSAFPALESVGLHSVYIPSSTEGVKIFAAVTEARGSLERKTKGKWVLLVHGWPETWFSWR